MRIQKFLYNNKEREVLIAKETDTLLEGIDLTSLTDLDLKVHLVNDAKILEIGTDRYGTEYVHIANEKTPYEYFKPALAGWRKYYKTKIQETADVCSSTI